MLLTLAAPSLAAPATRPVLSSRGAPSSPREYSYSMRVPTTASGGTPYSSSLTARRNSVPPPETMVTATSLRLSSPISSIIGW